MRRGEVKEGKLELFATDGRRFVVWTCSDSTRSTALEDVMGCHAAHVNSSLHAGDKLCGTRVIPLVIDRRRIEEAEALVDRKPLLQLVPFRKGLKAGIVTTGNEVFHGALRTALRRFVESKLRALGVAVAEKRVERRSDRPYRGSQPPCVRAANCGPCVCTGGMSVDPTTGRPRRSATAAQTS
jgi:hypothetical protein